MSNYFEKTIKTKKIYSGRVVSLREDTVKLPTGKVSKREIVEHLGAVAVVAIKDRDKIVLVRQFRKPANVSLLEIPAGLFKKGEPLVKAAKRELEEETGFRASKIKKVFSGYSSPGYSTEKIHFFIAKDLKKTRQNFDEDELIDVEILPIEKCFDYIENGKIKDNKTFIGIVLAAREVGLI